MFIYLLKSQSDLYFEIEGVINILALTGVFEFSFMTNLWSMDQSIELNEGKVSCLISCKA